MFSAGVCGFKSEWKIQNDEREIFRTKSGMKVNKLLSDKQSWDTCVNYYFKKI